MWNRLWVALAFFMVAVLIANVVHDSWIAALPLLVAPLVSGWRAQSGVELLALSLCGGAAYLLFLLGNGQLLAEPDPVDGSYLLVALYAFGIAFASLAVVSGGYVVKHAWKRAV